MIICMAAATLCFLFFAYLYLSADQSIVNTMVSCCKETEEENLKKYQLEMSLLIADIKRTKDLKNRNKVKQAKKLKKKMEEAGKRLETLQNGKNGALDMVPVAGYRLMQLLGWDGGNEQIKKLYRQCVQFKEKKEAMNYTYYLLGSLFGYVLLGAAAGLFGLGIGLAMQLGTRSAVVALAAFVIFALIGYLPYDSVRITIQHRAEEIENQFPQVISKMALLTVAGMEVNQAWKLSAESGIGVLYEEMQRVLLDFNNNVSPADAYSRFISRCNNPYTTKLATAILQNISKGNAEIVALFRRLNDESWMEHKHNARRKGEQIQSKLLVPTILMFLGIIILIIIPIINGFNF